MLRAIDAGDAIATRDTDTGSKRIAIVAPGRTESPARGRANGYRSRVLIVIHGATAVCRQSTAGRGGQAMAAEGTLDRTEDRRG